MLFLAKVKKRVSISSLFLARECLFSVSIASLLPIAQTKLTKNRNNNNLIVQNHSRIYYARSTGENSFHLFCIGLPSKTHERSECNLILAGH